MIDLPTTPSFRLEGRRALVSGASRGIGLAAAVALAEAGAEVLLTARSTDALGEAADAMSARGLSARWRAADFSDVEAFAALVAQEGPFDVYVNSAGMARHASALETQPMDFDAVANLNWRAAHFSAAAVARGMIEARIAGSIMTISSQMGHVGGIERSVYAASKHALEGMTKSMAIEWGRHGIRVNTICPTFIRTPLTEPTFSDPRKLAWVTDNISLGRVGVVEDIMGAVVFLAGDASAMVTGTSLAVDGGWTAA